MRETVVEKIVDAWEDYSVGVAILAIIGILLQMTYIRDVTHIAHLVAQRLQVAEHKVEGYGGACMAQVWVAIDGRTADVHSDATFIEGLKGLLAASERIV